MPSPIRLFGVHVSKRYGTGRGRAGGKPQLHCGTCRCPIARENVREVILRMLSRTGDVWYLASGIARLIGVEPKSIGNSLYGLVRGGMLERVKIADGFTHSFAYRLARKGTK